VATCFKGSVLLTATVRLLSPTSLDIWLGPISLSYVKQHLLLVPSLPLVEAQPHARHLPGACFQSEPNGSLYCCGVKKQISLTQEREKKIPLNQSLYLARTNFWSKLISIHNSRIDIFCWCCNSD